MSDRLTIVPTKIVDSALLQFKESTMVAEELLVVVVMTSPPGHMGVALITSHLVSEREWSRTLTMKS